MGDRKIFLKVPREGVDVFYPWPGTEIIEDLLDDGKPGDSITVELVEMTQAEYDAIVEAEAWNCDQEPTA
jgi:hypothetical protein